MSKPKVALYWCASCGGCEETVVDLQEGILDVVGLIDIILWPVALDFKYKHIEEMEDNSIAVSFINGAIRTSEQEEVAKLLRKKSQLVIAFGSCAAFGGIPALANLTNKQKIFDVSYFNSPSVDNPDKVKPEHKTQINGYELELPNFYETVYKLDDVIDVDYYIPGCPPTSKLFGSAVIDILEGKLPAKGAVLAPNKALCSSCTRNETKPTTVTIDSIKRVIDVELDAEKCFLTQGVICMGPATRDGCGQSCINGNMPCTGCFGPIEYSKKYSIDQGAKMIATLGGILQGESDKEIKNVMNQIVDPAGTFYKYGISASLLGNARKEDL